MSPGGRAAPGTGLVVGAFSWAGSGEPCQGRTPRDAPLSSLPSPGQPRPGAGHTIKISCESFPGSFYFSLPFSSPPSVFGPESTSRSSGQPEQEQGRCHTAKTSQILVTVGARSISASRLYTSPRSSVMAETTASPLKHFVLAKKAIAAIFDQLLDYVTAGASFVEGNRSALDRAPPPFFGVLGYCLAALCPPVCKEQPHVRRHGWERVAEGGGVMRLWSARFSWVLFSPLLDLWQIACLQICRSLGLGGTS